jgi:hypothetical protein
MTLGNMREHGVHHSFSTMSDQALIAADSETWVMGPPPA